MIHLLCVYECLNNVASKAFYFVNTWISHFYCGLAQLITDRCSCYSSLVTSLVCRFSASKRKQIITSLLYRSYLADPFALFIELFFNYHSKPRKMRSIAHLLPLALKPKLCHYIDNTWRWLDDEGHLVLFSLLFQKAETNFSSGSERPHHKRVFH